ncbi:MULTISPECIES: hypothetical protein [unclassified Paenibacillus]|uniref:hypothetical protein n=1 Tax=unclassified Paenibacillus TaxID=185978 RepID=UPI002788E631|nr:MULTISPECIES: hypothetical protein [unclassified Paenibacillus]MDQ0896224.1 hypothetical protein [Paenibacillus sp. V4I7]MDQ0913960.1 hypothetical protein [Paenibacillus sp. V4I5]
MFQHHEEVFIFAGQRIEVRDSMLGNLYMVRLKIGERSETVEPKEKGFLTGPNSEFSKLLGKKGCTLISANCANSYLQRKSRYRLSRESLQIKKWLTQNGAAQGGILYGEIEPGRVRGWYIVLMMQVDRYGGFMDYVEPGYQFLGEYSMCYQIREERGIDGIYNNGCEFFVTTVSGQEVKTILNVK